MDEERRLEVVNEFCTNVHLAMNEGVLGRNPPRKPADDNIPNLHGPNYLPRQSGIEPPNPYRSHNHRRNVVAEPNNTLLPATQPAPQKPTGPLDVSSNSILAQYAENQRMAENNLSPADREKQAERSRSELAAAVLNAQSGTLTFATSEQLASEVLRLNPHLKLADETWAGFVQRVAEAARLHGRPDASGPGAESVAMSLLSRCPAVMSEERRSEVVAIACQSAHLSLDPGGYSGEGYNPGGKSNVGAGTAELKAEQHLWNSVNRTLSSRREEIAREMLGQNKAGDMLLNAAEKEQLKRLVDEALEASRWLSSWKTQVWLGDKTKRAQKSLDTGVKCDGLIEELQAAVEAAAWQGAGR